MEKDKVLYHKKFKHAEVTVSKTSRKEMVQGFIGLGVLAVAIWYFFIR